ncbi:hypothetical protein WMF26_09315 [Sorangium sp. So ce185]
MTRMELVEQIVAAKLERKLTWSKGDRVRVVMHGKFLPYRKW